MGIRERTTIARPAAEVWPYVIRPERFQKWNSKISSMETGGEFRLGQPFTTHYLWKGRPRTTPPSTRSPRWARRSSGWRCPIA
jgi:uncharacterized protein YndB with AHSA1/START domain